MVKTVAKSDLEMRELRAKRKEEDRLIKKKMKASRKINDTFEDKIFYSVINIILAILLLIIAVPILYILACSFSDADKVIAGSVVAWPVDFTMEGYEAIFNNGTYNVISAFRNSIFYTVMGILFTGGSTILAAYPLSRRTFQGRSKYMLFFYLTTLFSAGLIPSYLLYQKLGLLDTMWVLILPLIYSIIFACFYVVLQNYDNNL